MTTAILDDVRLTTFQVQQQLDQQMELIQSLKRIDLPTDAAERVLDLLVEIRKALQARRLAQAA